MKARFSGRKRLVREQLFPSCSPNYFLVFPHLPTFPHIDVYARLGTIMVTAFGRTLTNVTRARVSITSLVSIVEKRTVVRARDLYRSGIHPEALTELSQLSTSGPVKCFGISRG